MRDTCYEIKLGARNSKLETRKNETNADKHQYRT